MKDRERRETETETGTDRLSNLRWSLREFDVNKASLVKMTCQPWLFCLMSRITNKVANNYLFKTEKSNILWHQDNLQIKHLTRKFVKKNLCKGL